MTTSIYIQDGGSGDKKAIVTPYGQLVVAPLDYNQVSTKSLAVADTAYNLFPPINGMQFVVTIVSLKASRNVSNTTDADVIIYEAGSSSETTVLKELVHNFMVRGDATTFQGMNLLVSEGVWINAKTTDAAVFVNLYGYYLKSTS